MFTILSPHGFPVKPPKRAGDKLHVAKGAQGKGLLITDSELRIGGKRRFDSHAELWYKIARSTLKFGRD